MKRITILLMIVLSCGMMIAQVPNVQLKDWNGKDIETSDLNNKKSPVIIYFFATWCQPCKRQMTALDTQMSEIKEKTGLKFILVSLDLPEEQSGIQTYAETYGWIDQIWLDPEHKFSKLLNCQNIPDVFLYDSNGKDVYHKVGYSQGYEYVLFEEILKLQK